MTAPFTPPAADDTAALRDSLYVASKRPDPPTWARVLHGADQTGLPSTIVARNLPSIDSLLQQNAVDPDYVQHENPGLALWLRDPDNATLAKHELAPLARVDRGVQAIAKPQGGFLSAFPTGYADLEAAAGQLGVLYGLVDPNTAAHFVAGANARAAALRASAPQYAKDYQAAAQTAGAEYDRAAQAFAASAAGAQRQAVAAALRAFGLDGEAAAVDAMPDSRRTVGAVLDEIGAAIRHPRGFAYSTAAGAIASSPALVLGAITAAGGPVTLAGGTFLGMLPVSVAGEVNAEMQRRGVNITDPAQLAQAYRDPQLMASVRSIADRKGLTVAAVTALLAPFAGKLAAGSEGAGLAARAAATGADVGIQAAGQGAADLAGQVVAGQKPDMGEAVQTGIGALGFALGSEALGVGRRAAFHSDVGQAGADVHATVADALKAEHDAQALAEIGQAVREAPTTASVPDRLNQLVETASGGRDASTVYFQSGDWDDYWTAKGASPAKAAAQILGDDGQAYFEAKATGGPMAIPLGEYVARVAPTEHFDGLLAVARTSPDGMSLGEARSFLADLPATMQTLVREASGTPAEAPAPVQPIAAHVAEQLRAAGVPASVAKTQSTLYDAAFRRLAERSGLDPQALYDRYALTITGENAPPAESAAAKPATVAVSPDEIAAREALVARAERMHERLLVNASDEEGAPSGPYDVRADRRDGMLKTPEGTWTYARTEGGALRSNLATVSTDGLIDELSALYQANNDDSLSAVPTITPDENFHTYDDGRAHVGMKEAAVRASGRIAQRRKSIAKIEAELERRGVADTDERLFRRLTGADDPTSFDFSLEQASAAGPRGRIMFGPDGKATIQLFKTADRSTFLHETGHFYLRVLQDLAHDPKAPADLQEDYRTVREWLGAAGDAPLTRGQHETFARGFEAYLMEGRAPSSALRQAFYRFKQWLVGLYHDARTLQVEISPDVRAVFDRLLASREEIEQVSRQQLALPLFDDPERAGMSDAHASQYMAAVHAAREAAESDLTAAMMKQLKRQESRAYRELREPIRQEIEARINQQPEYRAIEFLRNGKNPDGSPLPDGTPLFKLDLTAIKDAYGADFAKTLPRGIATLEGGVHPDLAADVFGYASGKDMLDALAAAPPRRALINRTADQVVADRHGERMTEAELHDMAVAAVHNEQQDKVLRLEMQHLISDHFAAFKGLGKRLVTAIPPADAVRAQARRIIDGKAVRDIRLDRYEAAVIRSSRDAITAFHAGDIEGALAAKQKQLLATEVLRAAREARDTIETGLEEFRAVFRRDASIAKTREMAFVGAARAVLAEYGIGASDERPQFYLSALERYDPDAYEGLAPLLQGVLTAKVQDYRDLSVADFRALRETVGALWEKSRLDKTMLIDGVRLDRETIAAELSARIEQRLPKGPQAGELRAVTKAERVGSDIRGAGAWLRKVEHWTREMDGGADDGPFRRYFWHPVNDAAVAYRAAREEVMLKYRDIVRDYAPAMSHAKIPAPELNYTFEGGKRELVGALLHTGNKSNLRKLLLGGRSKGNPWGELSETGALDTSRWDRFIRRMQAEGVLTKADYDFVQGVWDLFEKELKPGAQRAHRALYGYYFDEVTADAFGTPFGEYRGGYYPAKADPFLVPVQSRHGTADAVLQGEGSGMFPSTGRGFTKARVEYNRPLLLDANAIPTHIDAELRFTHINPAVHDAALLIRNHGLTEQLDTMDRHLISDVLDPFLRRTAQQAMDTPSKSRAADRVFRALRRNAALQILSGSIPTAVEQLTHLPTVMQRVNPAALAESFWQFIRSPRDIADDIRELSPYMRTRSTAGMMEVRRAIDHVMLDPNVFQRTGAFLNEHGMILMKFIQHIEDHVTWHAAYNESLSGGADELAAVRHADSVVRETLGAYEPESLSRVEAGTPFIKAMAMFNGFFLNKAAFLNTETDIILRADLGFASKATKLLTTYSLTLFAPAVMAAVIKKKLAGERAFDPKKSIASNLLDMVVWSTFDQTARMFPFAGPALEAGVQHFGKGQTRDLMSSPALSTLEGTIMASGDIYHALHGRMVTHTEINDIFTLIGMLTGVPVRPFAKPVEYLHDVHTGRAHPAGVGDEIRGLVTGKPRHISVLPSEAAPSLTGPGPRVAPEGDVSRAPYITREG